MHSFMIELMQLLLIYFSWAKVAVLFLKFLGELRVGVYMQAIWTRRFYSSILFSNFSRAVHWSFCCSLPFHLGHVCFPENNFWKTIFQTFLCLFAIRKGGQRKTLSGQRKILYSQRKTLSGQRKTLSSQRKIWLGFQESIFPFGCVCFSKSGFQETTFQTFMCLFAIRKVG